MSEKSLIQARREADIARDQLLLRAHDLQERLKPAAVVEQVRAEIKRNAETGAERVVAEARKRPGAVGMAAAGAAALLVGPSLLRLARRSKNKGVRPEDGDHDGGQAQAAGRHSRRRDG